MIKAASSGPIVIDASAALAWFMPDEDVPGIDALLDRVVSFGAFAPSIWPLEIVNVLLVGMRRGRISLQQRKAALSAFQELPITIDEGAQTSAWTTLVEIADDLKLTVYDAAYLELALRKAMPLATLDNALKRAAVTAGAEIIAMGE